MAMKNEFRIFGPPGCGKTTMLKKLITERCAQFGSGGILVASYTKAAAYVLVEKNLPLDHSQIGTLHSHGYLLLGAPPFVLGKNLREEFNRLNIGYEVGPSTIDADDPYDDSQEEGEGDYPGNEDLSTYDRNRARLLPRDLWNTSTLDFAQRWEEFKGMSGSIDFTDMIELCLDVDAVPFNAQIGFFDEVQDFSALELLLVRKWASKMEAYYLAGDDDQCLYQFRGSTSDAFLNPPLPPEQKIILGQSYRLPRAIHARAMEWVKDITPREDKPYKPTNQEGEIEDCPYSFKEAQALMGVIQDEIDDGKSVMVIAACGYMLLPLISELRRNGVAFHNPYKPKKGQWNPIRFSHKTLTSARRLFNFILPQPQHAKEEKAWWTYDTFFSWAECLKGTTVIAPKMKTKIRDMAKEHPHAPLAMDDLKRWIPDQEHQDSIERGDLGWFQTHITDSWEKKLSYPFLIAENEGFQSLITTPSLVIGTIHSVKGAEADCVYLCPDLSMSGWESLHDGDEGEMAVRRQFYVGLTRARDRLVLCRPTSERSLTL